MGEPWCRSVPELPPSRSSIGGETPGFPSYRRTADGGDRGAPGLPFLRGTLDDSPRARLIQGGKTSFSLPEHPTLSLEEGSVLNSIERWPRKPTAGEGKLYWKCRPSLRQATPVRNGMGVGRENAVFPSNTDAAIV